MVMVVVDLKEFCRMLALALALVLVMMMMIMMVRRVFLMQMRCFLELLLSQQLLENQRQLG